MQHIIYENGFVMKIKHDVDDYLLNMRLLNMRCKHGIKTNSRGCDVIKLSALTDYPWAEWGSYNNHTDIRYHANIIMKMEEDDFRHAVRIVICSYDFHNDPCIWIDNLHSSIRYVREYGTDVRLRDIPFYAVNLLDNVPVISENGYGVLDMDIEHMKDAVERSYSRKKRSDVKGLIDMHYTLEQFLIDNPILLTCKTYFNKIQ